MLRFRRGVLRRIHEHVRASAGIAGTLLDVWGMELPVCPRHAVLKREIGASANCVDADMLDLTARLVSSHMCAGASVACFSRCFHLVAGAMNCPQVLYGI